jgi:hypothetical protein
MQRTQGILLFILCTCCVASAWSQQGQTAAPPPGAGAPKQERPEYRARSLPSDTFKPSEKVQEDFPVPFPEDI